MNTTRYAFSDYATVIEVGLVVIVYLVAMALFCRRFFRFSDHEENMDDEGGWK